MQARKELSREIIRLGVETGNAIIFRDIGRPLVGRRIDVNKMSPAQCDEGTSEYLDICSEYLLIFMSSPLFTDRFHENHFERREWKKENLPSLSEEARVYYGLNKLRVNNCSKIIGCIRFFTEVIEDKGLKEQIGKLYEEIPKAFMDKVYPSMSDQEKIISVNKLTEIVDKVISLIEVKG